MSGKETYGQRPKEGVSVNEQIYETYLQILREELVPAMGCTEPIAIAYGAALARETLGQTPDRVTVWASANIIKNVKSVVVPGTGGKRGIAVAAAAGIVAGDAEKELQVLAGAGEDCAENIDRFLSDIPVNIYQSDKPYLFHIRVELTKDGHKAVAELAGHHTNVTERSLDGVDTLRNPYTEKVSETSRRNLLNVNDIVTFADTVPLADIAPIFSRQVAYNTAIAEEGLTGKWGAKVGLTLLKAYGNTVHNRAKAYAAAGSDARMNGCEMPVIINSGSGNQGLTASLPVIVYARELGVTDETLYRALAVSSLITVHMKTDIGRLSAYCGATSAGCGAGAGICYLYGGKAYEISHTLVNAVAINSGMICDGAKASCAAKIASAVEAGLLGFQMQQNRTQFYSGEGIVTKGVENTIRNVGRVARLGMAETDKEIIRIMLDG